MLKKDIEFKLFKSKSYELDLINSNKKLLNLFPNLRFTSFSKGLRKTLINEGIL